jgi:hypothetical protein
MVKIISIDYSFIGFIMENDINIFFNTDVIYKEMYIHFGWFNDYAFLIMKVISTNR